MPRFDLGCRFAAAALIATLSAATLPAAHAAQLGADLGSAQQSFLAQHPGAAFHFEADGHLSRVYGTAFSNGGNAVESANAFLRQHAGVLGSDFEHLLPIGPNSEGAHVLQLGYDGENETFRFLLVGYTQHLNGVPVFRGDVRCLVRNEPGYPLVLVANALKDVTAFAETFTGRPIAPSKVDVRQASRLPLSQFGPGAQVSHQEQVIWAGYDDAPAAEPRLAYKFIITGTGVFDRSAHQRMLYVVDAETNKILFQEDQISHADVNVTVRGNATTGTFADACNAESPVGLPHARVTAGGATYFTDANGAVTIPNASNANLSIVSSMLSAGRYFVVNDAATAESSITQSSTGGTLDFLHNAANTDESDRAEVNAYYQANKVRDYLLTYNPTFPTIAGQLSWPINVQVTGTCNAFYDGVSINFYPAGGGCNNTAFSVVVHHEFGHHIVNTAGSGQGAYGEGFGDVMGVLVTDESRLAVGFQTCATGIRDADNANQYVAGTGCSSAGSAIHTCGTLLSGCVWDVRSNLAVTNPTTYRSIISNLAIDSVLLHSGTSITPQITIDFLTLDDDDANLANGTPHYAEINGGFSAHNMPGPAVASLGFSFPDGVPTMASPDGTTSFRVNVSAAAGTPIPGTGRLFYSAGASTTFASVLMSQVAANQYIATLPASACGSSLRFYVSASATNGTAGTSPANAPTGFYTAISATGVNSTFVDTVETAVAGWTLSTAGDTATAGLWTRGDPVGTANGSIQVQPETDVTAAPGVNCFFTGQGTAGGTLGAADVDGGTTTLTSPTMDASGGEAYVSYYRWYSNQQGGAPNADVFRVQISNNNGASWTTLETVGPTGTEVNGGWIFKEFRVASVVAATNQVRVRFIAEDLGTGSLIEAAVDEVRMRVVECTPPNPSDLDGNGIVDGADLGILLASWGTSGPGDVDGNGVVDGSDLGTLLGSWG